MMDILTLLKLRLNFTTTNVFDDRFGVKRDSGTWNGIIGKLVDRNIDLIAAELSITPEREEVNHQNKDKNPTSFSNLPPHFWDSET